MRFVFLLVLSVFNRSEIVKNRHLSGGHKILDGLLSKMLDKRVRT